jgi:hypothetical protein
MTKRIQQTLSKKAQDLRRPLPVEMLYDALQDRVHREVGRGRPAKTVRSPLPIPAPRSYDTPNIGDS